jgi:hypothetical protein
MFTHFHKRQLLHHRKNHRKSVEAAAAATTADIRLSDATIGIVIIEMKTQAALEAAKEHLLVSNSYFGCDKRDLLLSCFMRHELLRQLNAN